MRRRILDGEQLLRTGQAMKELNCVAIAGVGLIGGSLGLARAVASWPVRSWVLAREPRRWKRRDAGRDHGNRRGRENGRG